MEIWVVSSFAWPLDEADIGPVFQHQHSATVPEQLAGPGFAQVCGVDIATHQLRQPVHLPSSFNICFYPIRTS